VVAVNLGTEPVEIGGIEGSVALSTGRERDDEPVGGTLGLAPAEGAIVI
jgi:hypothetical protein